MDPIIQCLEIVNSRQDLTTAEVVKLIVKPLLETILAQNDRIKTLEHKIVCPVKKCNKTYTLRSHVTRHIKDIVARGEAEPLLEHKAELDKSDTKESPPGLADVTADPVGNGARGGGLTMRGGVALPAPASLAGGLPLPAFRAWTIPPHPGTCLQFPFHMEPEEPDMNLEYLLNTTGQAEGLPARNGLNFSPLNMGGTEQLPRVNQGMVPGFGAGVYGGPSILAFGQMEHWTNDQLFGNEPGYMGNIEQLPGGGIRDELAGSLGHPDLYDAQMGEFAPNAWQLPNATGDEGQQERR